MLTETPLLTFSREHIKIKNGKKMKTSMILCMMCLVLFPIVYLYPEVLTNFPDTGKPYELRIDSGYIYITDQYSVLVYDMKTFKLVKKLGDKGEGPQEFKAYPKITFTSDRLILCDIYKIIIYSKDFKLITHFPQVEKSFFSN
jgi:hypothetical protein